MTNLSVTPIHPEKNNPLSEEFYLRIPALMTNIALRKHPKTYRSPWYGGYIPETLPILRDGEKFRPQYLSLQTEWVGTARNFPPYDGGLAIWVLYGYSICVPILMDFHTLTGSDTTLMGLVVDVTRYGVA